MELGQVNIEAILKLEEPHKTKAIKAIKARQFQVEPIGDEPVKFKYDGMMIEVPKGGTMLTKDATFFALQYRDNKGRLKRLVRVKGMVGEPEAAEPVDDLQPEDHRELDASELFNRGLARGLIVEMERDHKEGFWFVEKGKEPEFLAGKKGPAVVTLKTKPDILRALDIMVGD